MFGSNFNPYILGICCNWCTYAKADQAGISLIQRLKELEPNQIKKES